MLWMSHYNNRLFTALYFLCFSLIIECEERDVSELDTSAKWEVLGGWEAKKMWPSMGKQNHSTKSSLMLVSQNNNLSCNPFCYSASKVLGLLLIDWKVSLTLWCRQVFISGSSRNIYYAGLRKPTSPLIMTLITPLPPSRLNLKTNNKTETLATGSLIIRF